MFFIHISGVALLRVVMAELSVFSSKNMATEIVVKTFG